MSEAEHVDYFRQRAAAERELAREAPDQYIAEIHFAMADAYERLIDAPEDRDILQIVSDTLPMVH